MDEIKGLKFKSVLFVYKIFRFSRWHKILSAILFKGNLESIIRIYKFVENGVFVNEAPLWDVYRPVLYQLPHSIKWL